MADKNENSPKVALVTGASSGIGQAAAVTLAAAGYRVFGTARKPVGGNTDGVEMIALDVRDDDSVNACVAEVVRKAGRIDAVVNNAGYSQIGALEETTVEEAQQVFDTNFFGVLRVTRAVLPRLRHQGGGRIVNVSSVLGFLPAPFMGLYAASKHALEGYTETLDHEVRGFGVRAVLVQPGFTRTNIGHNSQAPKLTLAEYAATRKRVAAVIEAEVGKGADPAAVAAVIRRAVTARSPRPRYVVGFQNKILGVLRRHAPAAVFSRSLRKQFKLEG